MVQLITFLGGGKNDYKMNTDGTKTYGTFVINDDVYATEYTSYEEMKAAGFVFCASFETLLQLYAGTGTIAFAEYPIMQLVQSYYFYLKRGTGENISVCETNQSVDSEGNPSLVYTVIFNDYYGSLQDRAISAATENVKNKVQPANQNQENVKNKVQPSNQNRRVK